MMLHCLIVKYDYSCLPSSRYNKTIDKLQSVKHALLIKQNDNRPLQILSHHRMARAVLSSLIIFAFMLFFVSAGAMAHIVSFSKHRFAAMCTAGFMNVLRFERFQTTFTSFQGLRDNSTDACEEHDPCQHGGICISTDSGPICECRNLDYEGIFCEKGKPSVAI